MNLAISEAISKERERQDSLHPYMVPETVMLPVLVEEIGEVARAMIEEKPDDLRRELIEVAAVCVKWLELLEADVQRGISIGPTL